MHDSHRKPVLLCSLNDNSVRLYDLPSYVFLIKKTLSKIAGSFFLYNIYIWFWYFWIDLMRGGESLRCKRSGKCKLGHLNPHPHSVLVVQLVPPPLAVTPHADQSLSLSPTQSDYATCLFYPTTLPLISSSQLPSFLQNLPPCFIKKASFHR